LGAAVAPRSGVETQRGCSTSEALTLQGQRIAHTLVGAATHVEASSTLDVQQQLGICVPDEHVEQTIAVNVTQSQAWRATDINTIEWVAAARHGIEYPSSLALVEQHRAILFPDEHIDNSIEIKVAQGDA
jgi:hypothetical protein